MTWTASLGILWRPYFPASLTIGVVVLLLGLAVYACARSIRVRPVTGVITMLMRGVLILLLGGVLMGPSGLDRPTATTGRPTLRVMIDTSASMQTRDVEGISRFEFAAKRWLSESRLSDLREDYEVELIGFDESARVIHDSVLRGSAKEVATSGVSNIAKAVSDSVTSVADRASERVQTPGQPVGDGSAVVVFSDGRDSLDAPMHPVGQLAERRSVPVYTVALGGPGMSRDVAVIASPQQPYLFSEEPGRIRVRVMQSNAGRSATVLHVTRGEEDRTFPIVFEGRDTVMMDVPIVHENPGTYEYRVWAEPIDGEVEASNNEQPVFVDVTAKRLRVLILEGQPYWDTKFLAYALRRDAQIELTQVTQLSPGKHETIVTDASSGGGVPGSLEALSKFDVIILGRDIQKVLGGAAAAMLPDYVSEHGGRVVFARGRAYETDSPQGLVDAMSVLDPVVYGAGVVRHQKIVLEPAGGGQAGFEIGAGSGRYAGEDVEGLMPTLLSLPEVVREKAATRVLARAYRADVTGRDDRGQAAIVTMPYGQGMVAAVLGDGLWTWGLSPRRKRVEGGTFEKFWMDMVRWLALGSDYQPGRDVTVRLSRRGVAVGDPISLDVVSRAGFADVDARVVVDVPGGGTVEPVLEAVPGSTTRRRTVLHPVVAGVYRVRVLENLGKGEGDESPATVEAKFNCYDIDIERLHTSANRGALRTLAETSGGRCLDPDKPGALKGLLDKRREAAKAPAPPYYLWDRGWVLGVLLAWAGAEWMVRRTGGLL